MRKWLEISMKGLGWVRGYWKYLKRLGWVWNVWDGYRGSGVGEEGLEQVWRFKGGYTWPRRCVGAKDGHGGPDMGVKVFWWLWRT